MDALNLPLLAVRYRLGMLRPEELPGLAMAAIEAGCGGAGLCDLACETHPTIWEHGAVFEKLLRDCDVPLPTEEEALRQLLRHYLEEIVAGHLPPREGMQKVVKDVYYNSGPDREYAGDALGLEHLIGAFYSYDELDDRPWTVSCDGHYGAAAIAANGRYIIKLASEWLQSEGRAQKRE